jgi:hypothetical protein
MEITLKKTKITSSILKQTLRSTEIDMRVGDVLGWCLFGKLKYVVIYRSDVKGLSIYPLFRDIRSGESFAPDDVGSSVLVGYWVKVELGGNYIPITYQTKNEVEKDQFIKLLESIKDRAIVKGQFFI